MDCALKIANSNSGLFMCSTTDSTTPKTAMSHMTHALQLSLAARRPASSPSDAYKHKCSYLVSSAQLCRVHRSANACLLDGTSTAAEFASRFDSSYFQPPTMKVSVSVPVCLSVPICVYTSP